MIKPKGTLQAFMDANNLSIQHIVVGKSTFDSSEIHHLYCEDPFSGKKARITIKGEGYTVMRFVDIGGQ